MNLKAQSAASGPLLSRRTVVYAMLSATGGLAIGVGPWKTAAAAAKQAASKSFLQSSESVLPSELSAFLVIDPDGSVTVRVPHNELGQGISTSLAMVVAEELECDWARVKCEYASANRNLREKGIYRSMATIGSKGLRDSLPLLLQAGASARARLVAVAATRLKCNVSELSCANGVVQHASTGQKLAYGELCAEAAAIKLDAEPKVKSPETFRLIGRPMPRLDTPAKIDGSAQFGIDARVPGMVYAALIQCPVPGGKLKSLDDSALTGRTGILKVLKLDGAVAVVADKFWRAKKAVDDLKIEWDTGATGTVQQADLDDLYRSGLGKPMVSARNDGDVRAALDRADGQRIEAIYEAPYQAHAAMEPLNATVWLQPERLDVWVSTQSAPAVLAAAAAAAGIAPENTYVHVNFVGGGFGRRWHTDETSQAVAIAKAVGKPVKLVWTREQDFLHDRYRPQAASHFQARLDGQGKINAMRARIAVPSLLRSVGLSPVPSGVENPAVECIATTPYTVPNLGVDVNLINTHVPVSFCRGVPSTQNGFFIESFMDELAHAAGQDPYRFRRAHLDRTDWIGVLDFMAEKSGWGTPMAPGRGRGLAILEVYGSVTGQVAEVTVNSAGAVTVDRLIVVLDCHHAANPNTIHQQLEGGAIFGLTQTLFGQITFKDGACEQTNFHQYLPVRMAETPQIETYLHLSSGPTWGGVGELGVGPTAPAVCNAVFAATGKRVRRLPLAAVNLAKL